MLSFGYLSESGELYCFAGKQKMIFAFRIAYLFGANKSIYYAFHKITNGKINGLNKSGRDI
jgi:hypothetical protein